MELILKVLKYFLFFLFGLVILFFINQILQFSTFMSIIHPDIGKYFLFIIVIILILFLSIIIIKIRKFPITLIKPDFENMEDLEKYKNEVLRRLNKNKILQVNGLYPENDEDIAESIKILNLEAEKVIVDNASWIFVSTAISQNGKLDGLISLFIQIKMVYKISKIYYQKPRLKELYKLYSNIFLTAFLIIQIEEINITEHLEPIISKFSSGKLIAGIPGIGQSIGLLTNMLFEGSTNCFLTLRIGLITKEYCDFLNQENNQMIRKKCTKESAILLGKIVSNNSGKITRSFIEVLKNISSKTVQSTSGKIKDILVKPFVNKED